MTYRSSIDSPSTALRLPRGFALPDCTRHHLTALGKICRQCANREIFPEEITPHLTALGAHQEKVQRLGRSLMGHLKVQDKSLRYDSVMGCVEAIHRQFGQ